MCNTDIKLESGECTDSLSLGYEDFELVEGDECLLQDIKSKLFTDLGALFYDKNYGAKVLRFIHGSRDNFALLELKQAIKIALKTDDRIVADTINVLVNTAHEQIIIYIDFKTTQGIQLSTSLSPLDSPILGLGN